MDVSPSPPIQYVDIINTAQQNHSIRLNATFFLHHWPKELEDSVLHDIIATAPQGPRIVHDPMWTPACMTFVEQVFGDCEHTIPYFLSSTRRHVPVLTLTDADISQLYTMGLVPFHFFYLVHDFLRLAQRSVFDPVDVEDFFSPWRRYNIVDLVAPNRISWVRFLVHLAIQRRDIGLVNYVTYHKNVFPSMTKELLHPVPPCFRYRQHKAKTMWNLIIFDLCRGTDWDEVDLIVPWVTHSHLMTRLAPLLLPTPSELGNFLRLTGARFYLHGLRARHLCFPKEGAACQHADPVHPKLQLEDDNDIQGLLHLHSTGYVLKAADIVNVWYQGIQPLMVSREEEEDAWFSAFQCLDQLRLDVSLTHDTFQSVWVWAFLHEHQVVQRLLEPILLWFWLPLENRRLNGGSSSTVLQSNYKVGACTHFRWLENPPLRLPNYGVWVLGIQGTQLPTLSIEPRGVSAYALYVMASSLMRSTPDTDVWDVFLEHFPGTFLVPHRDEAWSLRQLNHIDSWNRRPRQIGLYNEWVGKTTLPNNDIIHQRRDYVSVSFYAFWVALATHPSFCMIRFWCRVWIRRWLMHDYAYLFTLFFQTWFHVVLRVEPTEHLRTLWFTILPKLPLQLRRIAMEQLQLHRWNVLWVQELIDHMIEQER